MVEISKEFKEWAKEHEYRLDRDENGYFTSTHTQSAWDAWEARGCLEAESTVVSLKTSQG
jgi:hypothetical protein